MNLVHIVAACAALLTFVVAGRALASRSTFGRGQSWFIAAITALLGFLGLINLGEDWARMVLIPYAALD